MTDPLNRLSTGARLWGGAVLCLVTLGVRWSVTPGYLTPGYFYAGDCSYTDNYYCTPDQFVPGTFLPGGELHGYSMSARVFIVFAAVVLAAVAMRVRTDGTRRWARLATVSIGIAAVLAAADRSILPLICLLLALALAARPVWVLARPGVPR